MKLLVFFAVLALVYAMVRSQRRTGSAPPSPFPASAKPALMVVCAHCGLHVPQTQACYRGGRSYCCPAHRDLDATAS